MARSPGFGSIHCNLTPYSDSVSLRLHYSFKLATANNSLTHYTKGTQSHDTLASPCSHCLYAYGFRFYFTPLSGVLFAFPSRYLFTIGQTGVFSLGGWSPHLQTGFHVSRPTLRYHIITAFQIRGFHSLRPGFPTCSSILGHDLYLGSSNFARHYFRNLG